MIQVPGKQRFVVVIGFIYRQLLKDIAFANLHPLHGNDTFSATRSTDGEWRRESLEGPIAFKRAK